MGGPLPRAALADSFCPGLFYFAPLGLGIWLAAARDGRSGKRGDKSPAQSGDESPHSIYGQNRDSRGESVTASRPGYRSNGAINPGSFAVFGWN